MQILLIKWVAIILVPMILGAGGMWKFMSARVDNAKLELSICQAANDKNQKTIVDQQLEIKKQVQTCDTRIVAYDKLIKKWIQILNLKGVNDATGDTGNDILLELNGMYKNSNPN